MRPLPIERSTAYFPAPIVLPDRSIDFSASTFGALRWAGAPAAGRGAARGSRSGAPPRDAAMMSVCSGPPLAPEPRASGDAPRRPLVRVTVGSSSSSPLCGGGTASRSRSAGLWKSVGASSLP
ncbi:MAG TPA: hypothetical protein PK141_07645 [Polyangiaceae bacterium]|nr:hypothetical protein [Polyangiaceae bacterium]